MEWNMYKELVRPGLFAMDEDPEVAHERVMALLAAISRSRRATRVLERFWAVREDSLAQELFGLRFPGPIGLAAGFDKNAIAAPALAALGFDFVEIGTVTPLPQQGNPRPRMHRFVQERSLVNAMGFNNDGALEIGARLCVLKDRMRVPLGVSIGKGRDTKVEVAVNDYVLCAKVLAAYASYLVVNVSSPNTPSIRDLQGEELLSAIVRAVIAEANGVPVLVKLAPDLSEEGIRACVRASVDNGARGIIAGNTTITRDGLPERAKTLKGGASGEVLRERALTVVKIVDSELQGDVPIIGVGGVSHVDHVIDMVEAGASLVQLYTGFVYEGPRLPARLNYQLARELRRRDHAHLDELRP